MNSDIKNERFILVSENKSFKDILVAIADGLDKKRPSFKSRKTNNFYFYGELIWLLTFLTKKEPLLTKNSAKSSHNKSYYSSEKIKRELNFKFELINKTIT